MAMGRIVRPVPTSDEAWSALRPILGRRATFEPVQTIMKTTAMPDSVLIAMRLRCFLRPERTSWVSGCPSLDVFSQADTAEGAKEALREAVELWVVSCLERGTLAQAMREVGWHLAFDLPIPSKGADCPAADEALGEPFPLELTIPAFHAAAVVRR